MDVLLWVIIGVVAGACAKWVLPRDDADDSLVNICLAICGAVVAGYFVRTYNIGHPMALYLLWTVVGALIGAATLVTAYANMDNRSMAD